MPGVTNTPGLFRAFFTQKSFFEAKLWREDIQQHHPKHAKNSLNHDVRFELIGSATRSGNATIDVLSCCKGLFLDIYSGYSPPPSWLCHDQSSSEAYRRDIKSSAISFVYNHTSNQRRRGSTNISYTSYI